MTDVVLPKSRVWFTLGSAELAHALGESEVAPRGVWG